MNFLDKPKWKRILLAGVCVLAFAALAGGSYAAYNNQAFQRGIARNRDGEAVCFTSDYLQNCSIGSKESAFAGRTVAYSEDDKEMDLLSISINIYNYVTGNDGLVNQKDVTYDLKIEFRGKNTSRYGVTDYENSSFTESGKIYEIKNKKLIGRSPNSHKYTLTFSGADLNNLRIIITATPTNPSATNNQMLAIVLAPCTGSATNAFSFEGKYIYAADSKSPKEEAREYKGFNYEISISNGKANATLKWNTSIVEIDKYFLENLHKKYSSVDVDSVLGSGILTFIMDQSDGTGDYLIPFYIKDEKLIPDSWDMEDDKGDKIIDFVATEIVSLSPTPSP